MKVIGKRQSAFDAQDGTKISGWNFYCTYPLDKGDGLGTERFYLTDKKIQDSGFMPKVGDEINVNYNRFGKPATIELIH